MKSLLTTTAAIALTINPAIAGFSPFQAGDRPVFIELQSGANRDHGISENRIMIAQTNLLQDGLGEQKDGEAAGADGEPAANQPAESAPETIEAKEKPDGDTAENAGQAPGVGGADAASNANEGAGNGNLSGAAEVEGSKDSAAEETESSSSRDNVIAEEAPPASAHTDQAPGAEKNLGADIRPEKSGGDAGEQATGKNIGAESTADEGSSKANEAETTETSVPPQEAEPVAEQLKEATERPIVVLPEQVTEAEKRALKEAEAMRREEARQNRDELLGAAAVGAAIGALVPLLGGKLVEDEGDRIIVERDGEYFVRRDENALLRERDVETRFEQLSEGRTRETMTRRNGVQIVTLRDSGGYIIRRTKILPNGDEIVLIDTREERHDRYVDFDEELPELYYDIDDEDYIVSARGVRRERIRETFLAPPVERVERAYSLREIRGSKRLRDKLRRLDLDTITFDTGSAAVRESQIPLLESAAEAIAEVIDRNPAAVFLIEGHTDAVGSELYNLALSDRRAETVARIMIGYYELPPENFIVEGYGEAFLKIETQEAERENRRATIRNITPLMVAR